MNVSVKIIVGVVGVPPVSKAERLSVMRWGMGAIASINKYQGCHTRVNWYYVFDVTIIYHINV